MIFGQNFYNIENIEAHEIESILIWLKKNKENGKLESNLPFDTVTTIKAIEEKITLLKTNVYKDMDEKDEKIEENMQEKINILEKELNNLKESLKIIDGGTYNDDVATFDDDDAAPINPDEWEW